MRIIADLHIHSKYSRACSKDLDLEHINEWAKIKGIDVVASADWTHPLWLKELKEKLAETKPGLFQLKHEKDSVYFMLNTEVSCIYKQGDKTRRLHICLFVPDFETADEIIFELGKRNVNLKSDGRPIMGLHADELAEIVLNANSKSMVVPAHAWTPWFSVFGSYSGFDSLEECFGNYAKYIYAIETGLSSDPPMNWQCSQLDKITLISNSDAHSPANLGREANVFEITEDKLSYDEICRIIKEKDKEHFLYTLEFFPEEGKYHWDGHRDCKVCLSPEETKKNKGLCPVCKKPLTIGVHNRVNQLADREYGFKPDTIGYRCLVPLPEIIAEATGVGKNSKKVKNSYQDLIRKGGNEFRILLDIPYAELKKMTDPEIALGIQNVREQKVKPIPGYDGIYGVVKIFEEKQLKKPAQKTLF